MEKINISIGILTWNSYRTLSNTLNTYKRSGLLDMVNDVCIFSQEGQSKDYKISREYNTDIILSPTNVGIGKAFSRLVNSAETDYILLLENDWIIIDDYFPIVYDQLSKAVRMLETGKADVVKLRNRRIPGDPLYTLQFNGREMDSPKHLIECVHWIEDPDIDFPDYIKKDEETGLYYAKSKYANHTNNPCLFKKSFYTKNISPFAGDGIDLEGNIQEWWQNQDFTVAHGEGLFTHYRIDR
jgi:hypothetical protein